jgi:hypothetical protein
MHSKHEPKHEPNESAGISPELAVELDKQLFVEEAKWAEEA